MKVVSKEAKKSTLQLNGNQLFEAQQAIQKVLETSSNIKGFYVRKMISNLSILDPIMFPVIEKHGKLVLEYVEKDENGSPIRLANGFKFEDDDKKQKYEAEASKVFEKELYDISFDKMSVADFDAMPINTKENHTIYLVLKYLVE